MANEPRRIVFEKETPKTATETSQGRMIAGQMAAAQQARHGARRRAEQQATQQQPRSTFGPKS